MSVITYAEAVRTAMSEEIRRDESVFFMGEDIGKYCGAFGVSRSMFDEFGEECVIDTPISETTFVRAGTGTAAQHSHSLEQMYCHVPTPCVGAYICRRRKGEQGEVSRA